MITKFERKVIAGLTAFLMCLSMVLAVPVSVNAEAEQTQDEAVSGAKQEETVSDVQMHLQKPELLTPSTGTSEKL